MFVTELVRSLRDGGFLEVDGRTVRLARDAHDLDLQQFPETVQDVVAGNLDRLTPSQHLTVKVASVVGGAFSMRVLLDVHPLEHDEGRLLGHLAVLEAAGILVREGTSTDVRYAFRHHVIQEVAYGLLVSAQRRALHQAVAEWHERRALDPPPYALLAHHWTEAADHVRALVALERAGTRAAGDGAVRETIRFFQQALDLSDAPGVQIDALQRARWLRELGEAHLLNSAPKRAREALDAALALVGRPLPRSRAALAVRLTQEVLLQGARLVRSGATRAGDEQRQVLEVETLGVIADQAFFNQNQFEQLTALLAGINAAERTGNTRAMCRTYASGGYIVSLFGLERLARRWWARAIETQEPATLSHAFLSQAMHAVDVTHWDDAERLAGRALAVSREAGAHLESINALIALMFAQGNRGDLDGALWRAREALAEAQAANLEHRQIWCHHGVATCLLAKERHAEAWLHTRQAIDLMPDVTDTLTIATHMSHRVEFALIAGDLDEAEDFATRLLASVTKDPPAMMGTFNIYFNLMEFFLDAWQRAAAHGQHVGAAREPVRRVHRKLRAYARLFPIARPTEARIDARIQVLEGSAGRARALLRRSLAMAERYAMPIAAGLAWEDLAMLSAPSSAERADCLKRAHALFAAHGQLRFKHRVEAVMAEASGPAA